MLKAFNRPATTTPVVSVSSTPHGPEQQIESQQSTPPLDGRRTSLTLNLDEIHTDGDGASSAAASNPVFYAGVMLRGHKGDLVRLFELPPTERLLGDFHCAMRKRVLLQGRMYIFERYVCFYSAVFGFAKKRRLPMRTIKAVRKRKHLGFPNSLEIETDEYKEFFTSFLSREEAYQLIMKQLQEYSSRPPEGEDGPRICRSTDNGSVINSGAGHDHEVSSPRRHGGPGAPEIAARRSGNHGSLGGGGGGGGGGIGAPLRSNGLNGERSLMTRHSGSMGDDDNDDEEDGSSVWVMEPRAPPPVTSGARHVLHTTLPGSPREFFDVVLADSAPFLEDFLDSQGNRRINLTAWKRHQQLGHVRDMNFTAPIRGAFGNWGVSHTACFQSQRFCLYESEHIVFESSQTMTDIPYGDCFTVDQRWDIRRDDADPERPTISFDLHVRVPFTSRCLFKTVIENGSVKQVQETYAQFVEQLRPVMEERLLSRNTLNMEDLRDPQLTQTPRVNSTLGSLAARSLGRSAQLAGISAVMVRTPGGARPPGPQGFEGAEFEVNGSSPQARGGEGRSGEPSVARLLLSLGNRLAEGARGVLESGVDVVLNLTQCRTTPQMRFLIALVVIMFLANSACMLGYLWHGWPTAGGASSIDGGAGAAAFGGGDVGPQPRLLLPDAGAAASGLTAALSGGAGGGGGGDVAPYWVQRLALMQQEMQLLQSRMEVLSTEVRTVMTHLMQQAAAAGPTTGGADAVEAAAAAAPPTAGGGAAAGEL